MTQQVGRRQGAYPAMAPPTFTQFAFNGSVEAFGLPLAVHSLYSTAQTDGRQPMNRTGVSIDGEALKARLKGRIDERLAALEKITNPGELKDLVKLTDLYRSHDLKINSTRELESLLRGAAPENPAGKLEAKARSTFRQQRQGLKDSADRFYGRPAGAAGAATERKSPQAARCRGSGHGCLHALAAKVGFAATG